MKNEVKLSIIIPVYNSEKHLKQCVNSVINQTLKEIEIICIDDGSKDNSSQLLKDYSKKDERIKYYKLSKNSGAGIARNKGLEYAKGTYISFIDSDDFILDQTGYEKLYEYAIINNANITSSNLRVYNKNKEFHNSIYCNDITESGIKLPEDYGIPWFFGKNLFKRKFLMENNINFPDYRRGEDPVFLAKAIKNTDYIHCLPIEFYAYRYAYDKNPYKINNEIIEKDYIKHYRDVFEILKKPEFEKIRLKYEKNMYQFFIHQKYIYSSQSIEKNIKNVFIDKPEVIRIFELESQLWKKDKLIETLKSSLSKEKSIKDEIQSSKSWKITKPMRKSGNIIRKLKN